MNNENENEAEAGVEQTETEATEAEADADAEPELLAVKKLEPVDPEEVEGGLIFDLSEDYEDVFGQNPEFDSWDEFSKALEEFSKRTGFYYKPRSACTVEYLNEKRINSPIPDRFVYAKVKMICVHYGDPPRGENGHSVRKGYNYVGKGCESFLQVSFNRGALKVGKVCLIHKNHAPRSEDDATPLRQFRNFTFTEDLDILIAREVLRNNPFELVNGEKRWIQSVDTLKGEDTRLINLTPRLIKKRIRFLIDKFVALSHGRMPDSEDEMGNILYELNRTKRDMLDNPPSRGRKRKSTQNVKFAAADEDREEMDLEESGAEEERQATSTGSTPVVRGRKRRRSTSPQSKPFLFSSSSSWSGQELNPFLSYLRKKDEEDRNIRLQELELTKEELAFRKREMDFQRQRFEFEKFERKAHLDLLKAQLGVLERTHVNLKQEVVTKEREQPVEYTIVLDNNQHTVVQ